jgi:ribonuclease J
MIQVFNIANSLGYIDIQPDTLIDIDSIDNYPDNRIVILTTGSQAEPMSALTRMAFNSHRSVDIQKGDTVIISADPIPGNEKPIYRVINELYKKGAHVIYQSLADVHVSGHAYRDELMMLHTLIKPKYFIPVHGEYRMLCLHKEMAESLGMPEESIYIIENGDVLSLTEDGAKISDHVPASPVLIDGTATVDADDRILTDRIHLSEDGCLAIAITVDERTGDLACSPAVNSMGCFDSDDMDVLYELISNKVDDLLKQASNKAGSIEAFLEKRNFREQIKNFVSSKSGRRPMIIFNISYVNGYSDDEYYGDV